MGELRTCGLPGRIHGTVSSTVDGIYSLGVINDISVGVAVLGISGFGWCAVLDGRLSYSVITHLRSPFLHLFE